jgi:maltooligosyltrehalose trehalohydrolase
MTRLDEALLGIAGAAAVSAGGRALGADPVPGGVRFGVWAPRASAVEVVIEGEREQSHPLRAGASGHYWGVVPGVGPGARYRFRLDGGPAYPDPVSRFQPEGPHGASLVVDPGAFPWSDDAWRGIVIPGQVIYELHIGAFTPDGTFDAAIRELPALRDLGITLLEVMPVAEFPGRFNWGYDGVALFAPYHGYGDQEAFKRFVDAAHRVGLGVILDVVYNHFGPDGCYLREFSADYFTDRYDNEWGDAINFDGPHAAAVRELVVRNAEYWIREFHLDGLRLDATQSMHDASRPHVIAELAAAARRAALPRTIVLVAENEPQNVDALAPPAAGGYGLDAMWNDDYHHAARVALTGRRDGYLHDYRGSAQEFVSAARHGFLYQGQYYSWQGKPRGTPALGIPPPSFVVFTQNHDQVANTLTGERLHRLASPARLRAVTALTLLAPQTPMLFMGEEFAAAQPFPFFADHSERLRTPVREGRRGFLRQFAHYATPGAQATVPDPGAEATFRAAKLDFAQREANARVYDLYRDLLRLRREDPVIAAQARGGFDGAALGPQAFVLRWFDRDAGDRLLVVNLGEDLDLASAPEPLLAPPRDARWRMTWSSHEPRYGGPGALEPCSNAGWRLAAESATLLVPEPRA